MRHIVACRQSPCGLRAAKRLSVRGDGCAAQSKGGCIMGDMRSSGQQMEDCGHDCMACQAECGEKGGGAGALERTLFAVSEVDSDALLKALQEW